MSKKKDSIRCCGKKLKAGAKICPRCHRMTGAGLAARIRKAVASSAGPQFVGKSAAKFAATTASLVTCTWCHRLNRPDARFCVKCQELMPGQLVPSLSAVKSDPGAYQYWLRKAQRTNDGGEREVITKALGGQNGGMVA